MTTQVLFRGSAVRFETTFVDADSVPVIPSSAKVYLTFTKIDGTVEDKLPLTMAQSAGVFFVQWDSSVAAPGPVYYSVRSQGPAIADDSDFTLAANPANPAAP